VRHDVGASGTQRPSIGTRLLETVLGARSFSALSRLTTTFSEAIRLHCTSGPTNLTLVVCTQRRQAELRKPLERCPPATSSVAVLTREQPLRTMIFSNTPHVSQRPFPVVLHNSKSTSA